MKKALVEPGGRVAQVEPVNADPESGGIPFPIAAPLVWVDCPDAATPSTHFFNGVGVVPIQPAPAQDPSQVNARETAKRSRADQVEEIERRMSLGAPQEEINRALIDLLKE